MRVPPTLLTPLLLLVACSSFEPLPEPSAAPEDCFSPGGPELAEHEVIHMKGKLGIFPAGRAVFTFGREGDVYRTEAKLETTGLASLLYGVDIEAEGTVGVPDKRSIRYSWSGGSGEDAKRVDVVFGPETGRIRSEIRTESGTEEVVREDPRARDPLAMVYALRRADLTPGLVYHGAVFSEWNLYRAEAAVVGTERAQVPAGEFETVFVRIDLRKIVDGVPEEKSRGMAVWLTNDDHRIPVRIALDTERGRVTLSMTEYRQGKPPEDAADR